MPFKFSVQSFVAMGGHCDGEEAQRKRYTARMTRLFLLDGTALAYRAHFAMQRSGLTMPDGKPIGATYGFTMTLRRILEQEKPDLIAVAFDPPGLTFRHAMYPEYKATRQKMPDELVGQLDYFRDVVRAHGIPVFEVKGFEADDVIGTLSTAASKKGYEVMIVTGDKDFMQLVDERVTLYNVFKPGVDLVIESFDAVKEKFHTDPAHVIDVLAIMGDSSDHVPGVRGIGEKGALKLIDEYGTLENILAHVEDIKGKAREHILRDMDQLKLSLDLVTIRTNVPLDPGLEGIKPPDPDPKELVALFHKFGFQSLVQKVSGPARSSEERDYVTVTDRKSLEAMIAELTRAQSFAVDTETTSLFPLQAEIVGASFSAKNLRAFYVPFNADPPVLPGGRKELLAALTPLLTDPKLERIGQNTKYDWLVFKAAGLSLPPPDFDTMVASYCAVGSARRHGLDELALTFFDLQKIPTNALIGTGKNQVTMDLVPVEKVAEYACEDADVTFRLKKVLERELEENEAVQLFRELEMPLVPVLTAMEERGITLDVDVLSEIGKELEVDIDSAVKSIHALAGEEFNVNSTKALGEVLFEKLQIQNDAGVKRPKKTKTGWSTDAATLEQHYEDVPIVKALLEYREVQKLKSTYLDTLPTFVNPKTGRVHCSFSQVTAATGRLASSDPNLQNIPVRSVRGRALRRAFVPKKPDSNGKWVLLSADYSQVELRVLAHLCGDPGLVKAFAEGKDIHAATAATIFNIMPELVTREMRSRAKAINFGLLYGMGPARLARETNLTVPEARQFIERYFASFPKVRGWIDATLEMARTQGYVETLLGRRRRFPEINSPEPRMRVFAENAAVNTPVQGSAADVIKRAMIELEARLEQSQLKGRLLLQVHDELLLETPESELAAMTDLVRDCMMNAVRLRVPLQVDFGHGANWLEAH
ncbi:MAG: DNA polymerase I [Planctomycetes bacterium]|nr:DNA polymerase I [Planctomycetota bacterium]